MKKLGKALIYFPITFAVIYLMLCVSLYTRPSLFLNYPSGKHSDVLKARKNGYPAQEIEYKAADGTDLYGWYTPGTNGKAILFAHGNAFNIDYFYPKLIPFVKAGYATMLPEYRGYGGIEGEINNVNLVEDTIAGLEQLYKRGYKNEDIIVYGMSLGSHMATATAYKMQKNGKFDALVLEVPFDNVPNVAKDVIPFYMPFDVLIKNDKYDNASLISGINTRLLVMAAGNDKIVPNKRAKALYEKAVEPKNFIMYDNAKHENLYEYQNYKDIMKWLSIK